MDRARDMKRSAFTIKLDMLCAIHNGYIRKSRILAIANANLRQGKQFFPELQKEGLIIIQQERKSSWSNVQLTSKGKKALNLYLELKLLMRGSL